MDVRAGAGNIAEKTLRNQSGIPLQGYSGVIQITRGRKEGRNFFFNTQHLFIHGYMASDIWYRTI